MQPARVAKCNPHELQNATRDLLYKDIDNNIEDNIVNNAPQKDFATPHAEAAASKSDLFISEEEKKKLREKEKKECKTLFCNSDVYALVSFDASGRPVDYSAFEARFSGPEYAQIDLVYYFHAVSDWSDQRCEKRTSRGWLATIRNFIRGDMERGKLHRKNNPEAVADDVRRLLDLSNMDSKFYE